MNNAFVRFGRTCVSMVVGCGILTCAAFAASTSVVTVNLPHAVTVGSTTLPSGHYSISSVNMLSGEDVFVIRSVSGTAVTIHAQKIQSEDDGANNQLVLANDGGKWSIDKLVVNGTGFHFFN